MARWETERINHPLPTHPKLGFSTSYKFKTLNVPLSVPSCSALPATSWTTSISATCPGAVAAAAGERVRSCRGGSSTQRLCWKSVDDDWVRETERGRGRWRLIRQFSEALFFSVQVRTLRCRPSLKVTAPRGEKRRPLGTVCPLKKLKTYIPWSA